MTRVFKAGIASEEEFNAEVREVLTNADRGIFPERPVERVYFGERTSLDGTSFLGKRYPFLPGWLREKDSVAGW